MREIKFRCFHKLKNKMYSPEEIDHLHLSAFKTHTNCNFMQYTGLKDKNSKEIYEGDIISAFHGTQLSAVSWNEKYGLYEVILQVSGLSEPMEELLGNHLDVIEVIGNIYENPELLDEEPKEETFSIGEVVKHKDAAFSEEFKIVSIADPNEDCDYMIQGPKPKYDGPFQVKKEKLIKLSCRRDA